MPPTPDPAPPVTPPGINDTAPLRDALLWTWFAVASWSGAGFLILVFGPRGAASVVVTVVVMAIAIRKTARAGGYLSSKKQLTNE